MLSYSTFRAIYMAIYVAFFFWFAIGLYAIGFHLNTFAITMVIAYQMLMIIDGVLNIDKEYVIHAVQHKIGSNPDGN